MEIYDKNTMDVDTDYEPADSAEPVVTAREPSHNHSLGDNASVVERSPVTIFDREEHDPKH